MKTIETFEQPGDVVTLVAPYDVTGGDGLLVGIIFGIAAYKVASGMPVETCTTGVFRINALSTDVGAQGAAVYWGNTNRRVTTSSTGNTAIGALVVAKQNGDAVAVVRVVDADGNSVAGTWLLPSGSDDSALLSEFVQDVAASGREALLGPGDFVIGTAMTWRSQKTLTKWGGQGVGLRVRGNGPGNTRLLSAVSGSGPMLSINAPTSAGIGKRNYLTEIGGMSVVRAPSGVEIATGSTSGEAIRAAPVAEALEVFHTTRFRDMYIDGFDYGITLSDATLAELDTVWFAEFLTALRLGYNVDICKIRHGMFGSEQFGVSYRNNAIAIQDGFSDGFSAVNTGSNVVEVEHTWFMKIGKAFESIIANVQGMHFSRCYFEDVRQYYHHNDTAAGYSMASFEKCHFSHPSTNDTAQSDPTLANYRAKIQADGVVGTGAGKNLILSMRDNTAEIVAPANAWVSFVNIDSSVAWENNASLAPSATYGHLRCVRTSNSAQRTLPTSSGLYPGSWNFGDKGASALTLLAGTPIEVTATVSGTYNVNHLAGSHFYLTLPDADCTIQIDAPSAGYYPTPQAKVKIILIAPGTVTTTRTITFGSRLTGAGATLSMVTGDVNKRAVVMLEGTGKGDVSMRCVSPTPTFV